MRGGFSVLSETLCLKSITVLDETFWKLHNTKVNRNPYLQDRDCIGYVGRKDRRCVVRSC